MTAALDVLFTFLRLGCTSFGGPVAHIGYFRKEFVERRRWLDDGVFADLVALCQFLPGPASSQLAFAIGRHRAGLCGAIAASIGFTAPSAVLMILFAQGLLRWSGNTGWLHGLTVAAVAVVAHSVLQMARSLCPDAQRRGIGLLAAAAALLWPGAWGQVGSIAAGGVAGWWLYRDDIAVPDRDRAPGRHGIAAGVLVAFAVLLVTLPLATQQFPGASLALADSFYRAGALVFGGGHVVLPLLRAELVPPGWISDAHFLAGYGAAQAVPGPLFTFAAYLGAAAHIGPGGWTGGLLALFAIFLPAWLLIGGALPFWHTLRAQAWAQAALRGSNAAVVGLLLAALITPVATEGIQSGWDAALAAGLFALLHYARAPAWLIVLLAAAGGAGLAAL